MINPLQKGGDYYEIYARVVGFHRKHVNASKDEDWKAMVDDLQNIETDFERNLLTQVVLEIEARYKDEQKARDIFGG